VRTLKSSGLPRLTHFERRSANHACPCLRRARPGRRSASPTLICLPRMPHGVGFNDPIAGMTFAVLTTAPATYGRGAFTGADDSVLAASLRDDLDVSAVFRHVRPPGIAWERSLGFPRAGWAGIPRLPVRSLWNRIAATAVRPRRFIDVAALLAFLGLASHF